MIFSLKVVETPKDHSVLFIREIGGPEATVNCVLSIKVIIQGKGIAMWRETKLVL